MQGEGLRSEERKHSDKAGIIFLFSLISVVFFMDIYIELSRIKPTSATDNKIQTYYFPSVDFELLLSDEGPKSIAEKFYSQVGYDPNSNGHSLIKLSLFFFLMASFSFYYNRFVRASGTKNKILSHYVSFVNTGQTGYTSPRSPPDFI